MAATDTVPNSGNLYKGAGIGYFKRTGETFFRDLGYLQLVNATPAVDKTDKYVARGGQRTKVITYVNQTNLSFGVTLLEWTGKNLALLFGGTEVAAVSLVTTGDTHSSTTLDGIASLTGLVHGRRYFVSGTGIPAGASFVYDETTNSGAGDSVTLDRAATATGPDVAITITAPISFGIFDNPQVTGEFIFVSDNTVGPKVRVEALNAILTPNGTIPLLDSDATDPAQLEMTLDVYEDTYGRTAEFYWNETTAWVPALA